MCWYLLILSHVFSPRMISSLIQHGVLMTEIFNTLQTAHFNLLHFNTNSESLRQPGKGKKVSLQISGSCYS